MANIREGPNVSETFRVVFGAYFDVFRLDPKKVFHNGFSVLRDRLNERYYTSVAAFSADFGNVFSTTIGLPVAANNAEIEARVAGDAAAKELISEFKNMKALAKRIIKAVQGTLADAMRKESELSGRPFEKELRDLDLLLENSMRSRRDSVGERQAQVVHQVDGQDTVLSTIAGTDTATTMEVDLRRHTANHHLTPEEPNGASSKDDVTYGEHRQNGTSAESVDPRGIGQHEPPTPPLSLASQSQPFSSGGIPWYMEPFDPDGTTIQDERWTGRELVRGMSEELSDMDEAELSGLVRDESMEAVQEDGESAVDAEKAARAAARRKAATRRKRNRGW